MENFHQIFWTTDMSKAIIEMLRMKEISLDLTLTGRLRVDLLILEMVKSLLTHGMLDSVNFNPLAMFWTKLITTIWLLQPKPMLTRTTWDTSIQFKWRAVKFIKTLNTPWAGKSHLRKTTRTSTTKIKRPPYWNQLWTSLSIAFNKRNLLLRVQAKVHTSWKGMKQKQPNKCS